MSDEKKSQASSIAIWVAIIGFLGVVIAAVLGNSSITDRLFQSATGPATTPTIVPDPTHTVTTAPINTPTEAVKPPQAPTDTPTETPTLTSRTFLVHDINGRWDHSEGAYIVFTRRSPLALEYSYHEYTSGGSGWGVGNAVFKGNTLIIEGKNGEEYANEYSGELHLDNDQLVGTIRVASGDEVPVTYTGVPALVPLPPSEPTSTEGAIAINGRWDGSSEGFVVFTRLGATSLDYSYQEFSPGGSGWGEGTATIKGGSLHLKGHNGEEYTNEYTGTLHLYDNQLQGIIYDASGNEIPVILSRNP